MRCLYRRVTGQGKEGVEYHESVVVSASIELGSAAESTIVLREAGIRPAHARITLRGRGQAAINAVDDAAMQVNGEDAGRARLAPGDVVEIGNCRIEVLRPPPGFDLALQTDIIEQQSAADQGLFATTGDSGWFTRRRLSWLLASAVLLVMFAVPVSGLFSENLRDLLRNTPLLPSDRLWDTGPLAAAHRNPEIGNDCNICHIRPFRQVENDACIECHDDVRQHVPDDSRHAQVFTDQSCMDCHKEHKEPARIVRTDQEMCTACHADAKSLEDTDPPLDTVADFETDHPGFRLNMLVPEGAGSETVWQVRRVGMDTPGLVEQSNLKFNHKVHLDPEGVDAPEGKQVMVCSDCHVDDAAGALMRPMTMEGQCRNCHSLAFDENAPDRELPHAVLEDVIASLEEYYSRLGLESQPEVKLPEQRKRTARRPGREAADGLPDTVLEWARREARITAEDIFERTSCNTCHDIERKNYDDDVPEWEAAPVRLNEHWMPHARFSHRDHAIAECADCHEAVDSEDSADVLMPSIDVCRDCHGGAASEDRLVSTCMDCHYLHNPGMEPLYARDSSSR